MVKNCFIFNIGKFGAKLVVRTLRVECKLEEFHYFRTLADHLENSFRYKPLSRVSLFY